MCIWIALTSWSDKLARLGLASLDIALFALILIYLKNRKGLRKFPAAGQYGIATFTPLWAMYYNWFGARWKVIEKAHADLGTVVRISPNVSSFSDPHAYKDIYGHQSSIIKDVFYSNMAGDTPNMADAVDRADHARKRKYFSAIFSAKNVGALESHLRKCLRKLLDCLKHKALGQKVADTDRFETRADGSFEVRP